MIQYPPPPGCTCAICGQPFRGQLARWEPGGYRHTGGQAGPCGRRANTNARHAAIIEDLEWLAESGVGMNEASARVGVTLKNAEVILRRNDKRDLLARLLRQNPKDHNRLPDGSHIADVGLPGAAARRRRAAREVAA